MRWKIWMAAAVAFVTAQPVAAAESGATIKIGGMCDLSGATKLIGIELCPGLVDYFALVNRKGGVLGHRLEYTELDHAYLVPRALEAYERLKGLGVVTVFTYGVPTLYGVSSRYMEDKIPSLNPGTGRADAIDGQIWPYIFPGTASYWSQAGVFMQYIKDNGAKPGTKIAYLYLDSPAGREGIPMAEAVAQKQGYVLRLFAVPPPGLEMEPQVREIAHQFGADWVIASLFGRPPSVAIKEFKNAGYPLNRVVGFVYGAGEADVEGAGWDVAQGYLGLQFASVGRQHPLVQELIAMLRQEGKEVPPYVGGVYYNRGVLTGGLMVEAIRLAIENHGLPLSGESVRKGYEAIKDFDLQGFGPPITFTPTDHEGGGYLKVYQVKGNEWVPVSDWIRGYREELMLQVRQANAKPK
jgi:branched-chain amino acid transport system substrate-binding protein